VLEERFNSVLDLFKQMDSRSSDPPIITPEFQKAFDNCMVHVRKGCLSDIPGVAYYYKRGEDTNGLTLYHCKRGTSKVESVHQRMAEKLQRWNYGLDFIDVVLRILRHRHNIRASHRNRRGFHWIGHYRYDLLDKIQESAASVGVPEKYSWWQSLSRCLTTDESFGIVPPVPKYQQDFSPGRLDNSLSKTTKYICKAQRTLIPYLRVQTTVEKKNFKE
jgi:hypothetical protein